MPLFASVCGNDYLQSISLSGFFGATKQRKPDGRPHPRHKGHNKFCEVLHHLTYYQTYRECLEVIVKQVPPPERATTELALRASCDMYEVFNESPIVKFFEGEDADLSTNLLVRDHGVPASFVRLLRQGEVPFMCLIIYLNRMYFLGAQVEKISEMRSSDCSYDLLRALTGIMLVDAAQESQSKGEALTIDIYDRDNMHVKCLEVEPLCEIPLFGMVPSFRRISNTSKHQRRLLLLACLEAKDINLNGIPEQFQLVLVVTVYWFRHAQPQVPQNLLVAMVLGWIQG
ncbi:hypothetical protein BSL78_21487 [Apostichopus japonicus]|uniref:Uncharacterized protein n=1 Tax=Stichopus japonicus TaxID=307972 RepID=A0A2G8K0Y0_STIJA|nr:hypothetical protein BSL78_21487 [Apostichopus japonicus]